jgi:hypothetical protein
MSGAGGMPAVVPIARSGDPMSARAKPCPQGATSFASLRGGSKIGTAIRHRAPVRNDAVCDSRRLRVSGPEPAAGDSQAESGLVVREDPRDKEMARRRCIGSGRCLAFANSDRELRRPAAVPPGTTPATRGGVPPGGVQSKIGATALTNVHERLKSRSASAHLRFPLQTCLSAKEIFLAQSSAQWSPIGARSPRSRLTLALDHNMLGTLPGEWSCGVPREREAT